MTKRRKGPVIQNAAPPKANNLAGRVRSWMVRPELLKENPNWMGKRVASSGEAWEEPEPEPDEEKKRQSTGNGVDEPLKQKKRRLNVPVSEAALAGKRAKILGNVDADELFGETEK